MTAPPPPADSGDSLRRLADLDAVSTIHRLEAGPHAGDSPPPPGAPLSAIAPLRTLRPPTLDTAGFPGGVPDAATGTASLFGARSRPPGAEAVTPAADRGGAAATDDLPDYELLELVGRGGQGEVWRAFQRSLHREVAVKRLHAGSKEEFLQEAYTTAELDHPNIVPVHDLGRVVEGGREEPLIAMKLVSGAPWDRLLQAGRSAGGFRLDDFLATHLRILIDVCNAVAFAHARGILHRDLKPAQVMVGEYGEVLLMDWGLAVSLDRAAPRVAPASIPKHRTLETASNQCGSPAYMAPEQTLEATATLGTHTDVYLLGAILYEVLAGRPPHWAPSARAAYLRAAANDIDPLPSGVPPELADLAGRALATDPSRRPASARELRQVLEDFLSGAGHRRESEAIVAETRAALEDPVAPGGGAEARYARWMALQERLGRALRLWPGNGEAEALLERVVVGHAEDAIAARDLVLARALIAPLRPAARDPLVASVALQERRLHALARQRRLLQAATITLALLVVTLVGLAQVREATLDAERAERALERERRDVALARLEEEEARSALLQRANELRSAETQLAQELRGVVPAPAALPGEEGNAPGQGAAVADLAAAEALLARRDALLAERAALETAGVYLGAPPHALLLASADFAFHAARDAAGFALAVAAYEQAIAARPDVPGAHIGRALALVGAGRPEEAAPGLREALRRIADQGGTADPEHARTLVLLGDTYRRMREDERFGVTYNEFYEQADAVLAPRWVEETLDLARIAIQQGDHGRGELYSSAALRMIETIEADATSPIYLRALTTQASAHELAGRRDLANEFLLRALPIARAHPETHGRRIPGLLGDVADNLFLLGRRDEALELAREAIALANETFPPGHPSRLHLRATIIDSLILDTRFAEAEELALQAQAEIADQLGEDSLRYTLNLALLGQLYLARQQYDKAAEVYPRTLRHIAEVYGEDNYRVHVFQSEYAQVLNGLGRHAEADALNRAAIQGWVRLYGTGHPGLLVYYNNFATSLDDQGRFEEGLAYHALTIAGIRRHFGPDHPNLVISLFNVAVSLFQAGHLDDALIVYRHTHERARRTLGEDNFVTIAVADDMTRRFGKGGSLTPPERRRLLLSLVAWIERALDQRGETTARVEIAIRRALLQRSLRMMMSEDPPRRDLGLRLARRNLALDQFFAGRFDVAERREMLLADLGEEALVDDLLARVPPLPEAWEGRGAEFAVATADFRSWIDAIEPPVDWAAEFPDVVVDPSTIAPSGEALEVLVRDVLRASLARAGLDAALLDVHAAAAAAAAARPSR